MNGTALSGQSVSVRSKRASCSSSRARVVTVRAAVKKSTRKNVVKNATLVAEEGQEEKVAELCKAMVATANERINAGSDGILEFSCAADSHEAGVFHFWERYRTHQDMSAFNSSEAVQSFMQEVDSSLKEPVGMALYEWQNGQLGAASTPCGPHGEGGLEDASGGNQGSGGGATLHQTSGVMALGKVRRGDEGDSWGMPQLEEVGEQVEEAVDKLKNAFGNMFAGKK